MMKAKNGFTLIELMIVVAIIGVLTAIAFPLYQTHLIKFQLTAAASELKSARAKYEIAVNEGAKSGDFTMANMALSPSHYCDYVIHVPDSTGNSQPALECQLKHVKFTGQSIFLNRQVIGVWGCSTTSGISDKYKPDGCM